MDAVIDNLGAARLALIEAKRVVTARRAAGVMPSRTESDRYQDAQAAYNRAYQAYQDAVADALGLEWTE